MIVLVAGGRGIGIDQQELHKRKIDMNTEKELERAYRCIRGLYGKIAKGEAPDKTSGASPSPSVPA